MGASPCETGVELTLHTSWVITQRDLLLVPGLQVLARGIAESFSSCFRELLLTIDSPQKEPASFARFVSSRLGRRFRARLGLAAAEAAAILGGGAGPVQTRHVLVNYSSQEVLRLSLGQVLGIPADRHREVLPHLAKHTVAHAYALALCETEYLLHFDSDMVSPLGAIGDWLRPSLQLLSNSSWLQGMFAVSMEECDASYPAGTLDLVVPLREHVHNEYQSSSRSASRCLKPGAQGAFLMHFEPGSESLALCLAMCAQRQLSCSAVEWHSRGFGPYRGRCFHTDAPGVTALFFSGTSDDSSCYIKKGISTSPPMTRGPLYMRWHHHSARGPHFSMRTFVMRVPRFRAALPLLTDHHPMWWKLVGGTTRVADEGTADEQALWQENIETFVEIRLTRPVSQGKSLNLPAFAAFLSPDFVGVCAREVVCDAGACGILVFA